MGGTPANVTMIKASMDRRIQVVTGMNLRMVLESYFKINEEKLAEHLIEISISSIKIPEIQISGGVIILAAVGCDLYTNINICVKHFFDIRMLSNQILEIF